ncbi:metal ABC transporter substrate-binding protein [bacterium]|nr:metal ABC transporter substrate-binding protein [candidate division CSSED10-310 bacterium]
MLVCKRLKLAAVISFVIAFPSCNSQKSTEDAIKGRRLRVIVTTQLLAETVEKIGGERVIVTPVIGPGADPRVYRFSEGDEFLFQQCDVIFYLSSDYESGFTHNRDPVADKTVSVLETYSADLPVIHHTYDGKINPYVWMDPELWAKISKGIRDTLINMDADHAELYRNNFADYQKMLHQIDSAIMNRFQEINRERTAFTITDDSMQYYTKAFHLAFDILCLTKDQGYSYLPLDSPKDERPNTGSVILYTDVFDISKLSRDEFTECNQQIAGRLLCGPLITGNIGAPYDTALTYEEMMFQTTNLLLECTEEGKLVK